jgi:hypothetical protein
MNTWNGNRKALGLQTKQNKTKQNKTKLHRSIGNAVSEIKKFFGLEWWRPSNLIRRK